MKPTYIMLSIAIAALALACSAQARPCGEESASPVADRSSLPIIIRPNLDSVDCTYGPTSPPVAHQEAYERLKVAVARTAQWLRDNYRILQEGVSQSKPGSAEHTMYLSSMHEVAEFLNGLLMAEENLFAITQTLSFDYLDSITAIKCRVVVENMPIAKRILLEAAQRHLKIPRESGLDFLLQFDPMAEIAPKLLGMIDEATKPVAALVSEKWTVPSYEASYLKRAANSVAVLEKAIAQLEGQRIGPQSPAANFQARTEALLWARAARTRIERMSRFERVHEYTRIHDLGPNGFREGALADNRLFPGYFHLNGFQQELFKLEKIAHPESRDSIRKIRKTCKQFMVAIRMKAKEAGIVEAQPRPMLYWD